jgi:hypothetical protein
MKPTTKQTVLADIPRESRIFCESSDGSKYVTFHRLDGQYSYCTTEKGGTCHLHVLQELVAVEGGYALAPYEAKPAEDGKITFPSV